MTQQARIDRGLYWDRAWSLVEGCTPVSPGCTHCWSAQQSHIRSAQSNEKIKARYSGLTDERGRWTGKIRLMEQDLDKPLKVKKPTTWAVWNDLFHEDVPFAYLKDISRVMAACPQHTFQVLTKRPDRMAEFVAAIGMSWPNIWLGVTAENQEQADKRIPILLQTPAAVRFVSVEPMLGAAQFAGTIHLVICGGESGPGARPMHPDWARSLRDQCQEAGVPFFFKQWGEWSAQAMHVVNKSPGKHAFAKIEYPDYPSVLLARVGKKAAGRLLDGREWNEMPGEAR